MPGPAPSASASSPFSLPTPAASASPVASNDGAGRSWWAALAAALALVVAAGGWVMLRRRTASAPSPSDAPPPADAPPPPAPSTSRARLTLGFRPLRAGINLLSATSESEIVLANTGDEAAEDVRVVVRLVSAHRGQDTDLADFYAEPVGRPAVPAFTLAPGETRTITAVAVLPRDAIRTLTAAGRPMFVPIVAVNVAYATAGGVAGQVAQAFAVGVERVDSPKLAPFWLDTPPRTYDQVAARPHAAALER